MTPSERAEILRTFPSSEYPELDLLPLLVELRETGGRAATKAEAAIVWLLNRFEEDRSVLSETYDDLREATDKAETAETEATVFLQKRVDELEKNADAVAATEQIHALERDRDAAMKRANAHNNQWYDLRDEIRTLKARSPVKAHAATKKELALMSAKHDALLEKLEKLRAFTPTETEKALAEMTVKYNALAALWGE